MPPPASGIHGPRVPLMPMLISAVAASGVTALALWTFVHEPKPRSPAAAPSHGGPPPRSCDTVVESLLSPPLSQADADLAELNLLCAPNLDVARRQGLLGILDQWAAAIARETARNHHRYTKNPEEFGSETEWRLGMMCTVLNQDYGLRYDPVLASSNSLSSRNERFFAQSSKVFIDGCLPHHPRPVPSCVGRP